jgi:hypothetical protein
MRQAMQMPIAEHTLPAYAIAVRDGGGFAKKNSNFSACAAAASADQSE